MTQKWSGHDLEWRDDVQATFKGTHIFLMTECFWTSDPDEDPDLRSVCAHCGLDEKLGNPENPCIDPGTKP